VSISTSDPAPRYCATQQEDNAHLEALLRGTLAGKVDFSRVAIMRTASDFDRAPPGETEVFHLLQVYSAADFRDDLLMCGEQTRYADQQGFDISIENIFIAGNAIVKDVLKNWNSIYKAGIKPENYIGDLFNSLGSANPDIGTESIYIT
jgi:purine nucleoside permease